MVMEDVTRGLARTPTMDVREASNAGCRRIAAHQCLLTWETKPYPWLRGGGVGSSRSLSVCNGEFSSVSEMLYS